MNMIRTCRLSQLTSVVTDLPPHLLSSISGHDDSRFDQMDNRINTVTTAVAKTSNVVLDIHRLLTTPSSQRRADDDSSLQSVSSLTDFLDKQPDFRKAAQQK